MTTLQPNTANVYTWGEVQAIFGGAHDQRWDTLIIGNGASIAIDESFHYNSLYEEAVKRGIIEGVSKSLFEEFGTSDFEFVLKKLGEATLINQFLEVEEDRTAEQYSTVKQSLIETICAIHPQQGELDTKLYPVFKFLSKFKFIFSLNYDLLVYWAILLGNNSIKQSCNEAENSGAWFSDCFSNGSFLRNWATKIGADGSISPHRSLVVYPHGNLKLISVANYKQFNREQKIHAGGLTLKASIEKEWKRDEVIPLFVSEMDSKRKLVTINGSDYLKTVYHELLSRVGTNIVIYGMNLDPINDNLEIKDQHILSALGSEKHAQGGISKLAISIYLSEKESEQNSYQKIELQGNVLRQHLGDGVDIYFFDAQSEGCWNNGPSVNYRIMPFQN